MIEITHILIYELITLLERSVHNFIPSFEESTIVRSRIETLD
jgi:hypothetical protein